MVRKAFGKTAGTSVVQYSDAGPELRKKMDAAMRIITTNPQCFENVIGFGYQPVETLGKISKDLRDIQDKLLKKPLTKTILNNLEDMGKNRVKAVKDLEVYMGARNEVLKRYDEFIKDAKDIIKTTRDPENKQENKLYLQALVNNRESFIDQKHLLGAARMHAIVLGMQLKQTLEHAYRLPPVESVKKKPSPKTKKPTP